MIKKTLTWLIWKTLSSCKDVTALISRSHETNLPWREKLTMKIHLWSCMACRRYLSQVEFMGKALKIQKDNLNGKTAPKLSSDAAERLKDALKSSKFLLIYMLINCL